jgi:hypothetical protein
MSQQTGMPMNNFGQPGNSLMAQPTGFAGNNMYQNQNGSGFGGVQTSECFLAHYH